MLGSHAMPLTHLQTHWLIIMDFPTIALSQTIPRPPLAAHLATEQR